MAAGTKLEEARKELKQGLQSIADALCCPVCLELIPGDGDNGTVTCLPCSHVLCSPCAGKIQTEKVWHCPLCKEHCDRRMVQEDVQLTSMLQLFRRILPLFDFEVREDDSRRVSDLHNPTPVKPRPVVTVEASRKQPPQPTAALPLPSAPASSAQNEARARLGKRGRSAPSPQTSRPPSCRNFESESMVLSFEADEAFGESSSAGGSHPSPRQHPSRPEGSGGAPCAPNGMSGECSRNISPLSSPRSRVGVKRPRPSSAPSVRPSSTASAAPSEPESTKARQHEQGEQQAAAAQAQAEEARAAPMPPCPPMRFKVRDIVQVQARMGPRSNKSGGAAKVIRVREGGEYDVKYFVEHGGRIETKVSHIFLQPATLERTERTARRRTSMPCVPVVPFHEPRPAQRNVRRSSAPAPPRPSAAPSPSPSDSTPPDHDPTPPTRPRQPLHPSRLQDQGRAERHSNVPPESEGDSFVDRPHEIVLVATSLSERVMEQVRAFAKKFGARVDKTMGPRVTHVICKADKQRRAEQRTLKYLHGLLNRRWLLSSSWITDSLKEGQVKPELTYELQGDIKANRGGAPSKARTSRVQDKPSLFQGITFSFYGEFPPPKPTRQDLEKLIEAGKGRLVGMGGTGDHSKQPQALHQQPATYILCNSLPDHPESDQSENRPPIVTSDWILDSISNYELQATARYYPEA